jgi:very-short-patch-repair endonuclease
MPSAAEDALAWQLRAARLPDPVREHQFAPPRRFRWDFAWPDHRVAVEVDGGLFVNGRHSRGAGVERDMEKGTSVRSAVG